MKKVICFARVSTIQQNLDAQIEEVKRCAYSDGFADDEILVVTGKESAIKLDEEQRQTLNEIKDLVKNNPTVVAIYFFAVDRLARRMSVVMSVKEWADDNKINLVFLNPHRMSTFRKNEHGVMVEDEVTTLLLAMLSYGAQMEMKIKSARFDTAKKLMKLQGKLPQGKPIKGYMLAEDRTILIHPEESKHIINIFREYLDEQKNESLHSLHNRYVLKGFFEPLTSKYLNAAATRIYNILKDCSYCGREKEIKHKQKDGTYRISHIKYPAIIPEELFDAVQIRLQSRQQGGKKLLRHVYYAKGLVKCGECGALMRTDTNSCVYACKEKKGHCLNINLNCIDNITWLNAKCCWNLYTMINGEQQRTTYQQYINEYTHKVEINEEQIRIAYSDIDKANERLFRKRLSEEKADEIIDECTEIITRCELQIVQIKQQIAEYERLLEQIDNQAVINPRRLDALNDVERKKLIDDTIDSIAVFRYAPYVYHIHFKLKPMLEPFKDVIMPEILFWEYQSYTHKLYGVKMGLNDDFERTPDAPYEYSDLSFHLEEKRHTPRKKRK